MIGTYLRQSRAEKRLIHELAFELLRARLAIAWEPFRSIASRIGGQGLETPGEAIDGQEDFLARLRYWLAILARRLPWDCACLVRALAAQRVLHRRGLPSTLYLGVATGSSSNPAGKGFEAHAWLRCGSCMLTGGRERPAFTELASFADEGPST